MVPRRAASATFRASALALLSAGQLAAGPVAAQAPLPAQAHTIAAPTTGVPIEHTFTIGAAGTYQVTLTDLGASLTPPAPLASVKLVVTSGNSIVGTPLVGAGTLTLSSIAAGNYELHVVGMPGTGLGSGPVGVVISGNGITPIPFQDNIALPNQALPNGEAVLDDTFKVPASASYTVSLNDLQLPQSLTTLTLLVIAQGSATPVLILPSGGNYQAPVSLTAGVTYDIFAVGQPNASANAGLYSAVVTAGGGAVVYGRAVPVGGTMHLGSPGLAPGSYTLKIGDLAYPAALTQLGAALLLNGVAQAQLAAAGTTTFTAVTGTYEAYAAATAAAAAPGAGSYALEVLPQGGGAPAFAVARGVTAAGSAVSAFSFDTTIAAAGMETATLTDFQFPAALTSVSLAAAQGGALLGAPISSAGALNINAAVGPLSLVAFAQAANGSAGGLFGIDVSPAGGGTAVYDVTQAVGALFTTVQVAIPGAGAYAVTATDLAFPSTFANYDTIVTHGTAQVGSIFGGGTFNFTATPGTYFVNFIAQTMGPDQAGTYALEVAAAPAAPVVSLSVDHPTVTSGGTVDLIWSSQNATSCTASGGWSGAQALSGTATSESLTANTTFTLTCSGAGGMTAESVSVTVTPVGGGGGGGALGALMLAALAGLLAARQHASWLSARVSARRRSVSPCLAG